MTLQVQKNISLQAYNTFGIAVNAQQFVEINEMSDLESLPEIVNKNENILILGGGSNLLFTQDYNGLVIKNNLKGITQTKEDTDTILIKAMAGETWHNLVMFCVENNFGGIENLSLIPGCVGASPIQNIGAYGVELQDVFVELEAMELQTGKIITVDKSTCNFGYRNSIFKHAWKGKYIIISVTLQLQKNPTLNTSYGAIQHTLSKNNITNPTVKDISDAVIAIRQSKLPDPAVIGNAGSFFKNPEVEKSVYENLKKQFPDIPGYHTSETTTKIPAGWMIEQCGFKGKRIGNTGAHKDQALVLVNYGGATGKEIIALAMQIQKTVFEKFGVTIEPEVNVF
ncbi:MAG: UDP-N-acetylmuramate dehydrogenase [Chitinophagales bacterium]